MRNEDCSLSDVWGDDLWVGDLDGVDRDKFHVYPGDFGPYDLNRFGFLTYGDARPNDLTNDIWPALLNWDDVNPEDARLLKPCLRLASQFLNTASSISFLHAIMYKDRKLLDELSQQCNEWLYELPEKDPPSEIQSAEVALGVAELQNDIHWHAFDPEDPPDIMGIIDERPWAVTCYIPESIKPFKGARKTAVLKVGADIFLSGDLLNYLRLLDDGGKRSKSFFELNQELRLQFFIAAVICHELNHALNYTTSGGRDALYQKGSHTWCHEPFYKNGNYAELGRAWEQEVFGGNFLLETSDSDCPMRILYFAKWPYCNESMMSRHPSRGGDKASSINYYVSQTLVAMAARQSSWDNDLPDCVWNIPKVMGYRNYARRNHIDPTWRKSQSSEGKVPTRKNCRVLRGKDVIQFYKYFGEDGIQHDMGLPESSSLIGLASIPWLNESLAGDLQSWQYAESPANQMSDEEDMDGDNCQCPIPSNVGVLSLNNDEDRDSAVEKDSTPAEEPLLGLGIDLDSDSGHCEESDMKELRQWFEYPAQQRSRSSPHHSPSPP